MDRLIANLWQLVASDQELPMERRLYRLLCLAAAILCFFVIIPINLVQHISAYVNLPILAFGLFASGCYHAAGRGHTYPGTFYFLLVLVLNIVWFLNGAADSSVGYIFFAAILYPLIFWQGPTRWGLIALFVIDVWLLMSIAYFYPALVIPFRSPADRLLELVTGFGVSALTCIIMCWAILTSFRLERHKLQQSVLRLADAHRLNADIIEFLPDATFVLDREHRVIAWNRAIETMTGIGKAEIIGKDGGAHAVPFYGHPRELLADHLLAGREVNSGVYDRCTRQGATLTATVFSPTLHQGRGAFLSGVASALYDRDGQLCGAIESIRDITEQVQAEAAVRQNEEELRSLMELLPVGIIWVDRAGRVEFANRDFIQRFGYSRQEISTIEQLLERLYPDPDCRQTAHGLWHEDLTASCGTILPVGQQEIRVTCRDGSTRLGIFNKLVTPNRVVGIITDITERELLQHELIKRQKIESLGVLAGGIAHDFNNILTAILGNISFALMFLDDSHRSAKLLQQAEIATKRAAELAQQLLTFAKGGQPVTRQVAICPLLHESIALALRGTNVTATASIPPTLPDVEADEGQLSQAFNNLLINAAQAMPRGGTIRLAATVTMLESGNRHSLPPGSYVCLSFSDEGCGIPDEEQDKIFDPYFSTKAAGSGLGLASVHSIVTRHHGTIEVQSSVGAGATFTILLPAVAASSATPQAEQSLSIIGRANGERILVMDDEAMIRELLGGMLQELGYQVTTCSTGEEALELYRQAPERQEPFAAAILDLTIAGGMGGLPTAQAIRAFDADARLIVSSGYANDPVLATAADHGFCAVLAKPYRPVELDRVLARVLVRPGGHHSADGHVE